MYVMHARRVCLTRSVPAAKSAASCHAWSIKNDQHHGSLIKKSSTKIWHVCTYSVYFWKVHANMDMKFWNSKVFHFHMSKIDQILPGSFAAMHGHVASAANRSSSFQCCALKSDCKSNLRFPCRSGVLRTTSPNIKEMTKGKTTYIGKRVGVRNIYNLFIKL